MDRLTLEEAREALIINRERLDEECQEFADVFFEVSEQYAKAASIRDEKLSELKRTYAELAKKLREGSRVAKNELDNLILPDKKYQRIEGEYQEARYEADRWRNMLDAFQQKSKMLREVCHFVLSGFFSNITVKGEDIDRAGVASLRSKFVEGREKIRHKVKSYKDR